MQKDGADGAEVADEKGPKRGEDLAAIYYYAIAVVFAEPRWRVMIQTNDADHNSWPFGKNGIPSHVAGT